jgi:hypothetical protein
MYLFLLVSIKSRWNENKKPNIIDIKTNEIIFNRIKYSNDI